MDMTSERMEGVSPAPIGQYQGPKSGDGAESMDMVFDTVGSGNPGPTANLRGVSSNTALMSGRMEPSVSPGSDQNIPSPSELTYSAPISAPDSTGLNSSLSASPVGWNGPDTKNVRPISIVQDSFDEMREHYQGNPMGVDDGPY